MAGSNNLYLEPIINGAVGDMGTNIAAMNTQLSETTRILMNILNNQGLEQHQSAYNGATFSALTISPAAATAYNISIPSNYSVSGPNSIRVTLSNPQTDIIFESTNSNVCDLSNITAISMTSSGKAFYHLDLYDFEDNKTTLTAAGTIPIPAENRKQWKKIVARALEKITSTWVYSNIVFSGGNFEIKESAHLDFNANNLLTYATSNNLGLDVIYTETKTVYITIPDIQGVATWVSAILKGNLDGVSVALVDNTTHELIKVLPTATSDISDVQQLSGLALMVTFAGDGNALKYMSGFTMRYY